MSLDVDPGSGEVQGLEVQAVVESRFRWLGAAGFELQLGSVQLLIDPYLSRSQEARPLLDLRLEDLDADAIFLTHGHFDHAYDAPALAQHTGAPVYASIPVCGALHDIGVPARQLHRLVAGRICSVREVTILAIPARHVRFDLPLLWRGLRRVDGQLFRVLRQLSAYPKGDVLGYQFTIGGRTAVHFGSAGWYREAIDQLCCDVALVPLQGRSDIHKVATRMVELLRPKRVIPHHHDDFFPPISERVDVGPFFELVHKRMPEIETVEPRIGEWMPLFIATGKGWTC